MISIDQLRVRQNRQDIHSIGSTLQKGTAAWLYQFWTKGILEHEPSNVPWILEHLVKIHFPTAHSSVQARWTSIRNANSSGFEHDVGQLSPGRSGKPTTCARESLWWKSKNPNCSERLDETIVLPAHTGDSLSNIPALWFSLGFWVYFPEVLRSAHHPIVAGLFPCKSKQDPTKSFLPSPHNSPSEIFIAARISPLP